MKQQQRSPKMAKKIDDIMAALPAQRRARIEGRAMELATLKDLRKAAEQTQEDLALALGVGQDTISRLEKRSDMLLSTLRHYVESMGGKLELVAQFPNRPPVVIDHLGLEKSSRQLGSSRTSRARSAPVVAS
jgi:DNA-binding XRE family transcriptional regulator